LEQEAVPVTDLNLPDAQATHDMLPDPVNPALQTQWAASELPDGDVDAKGHERHSAVTKMEP